MDSEICPTMMCFLVMSLGASHLHVLKVWPLSCTLRWPSVRSGHGYFLHILVERFVKVQQDGSSPCLCYLEQALRSSPEEITSGRRHSLVQQSMDYIVFHFRLIMVSCGFLMSTVWNQSGQARSDEEELLSYCPLYLPLNIYVEPFSFLFFSSVKQKCTCFLLCRNPKCALVILLLNKKHSTYYRPGHCMHIGSN